MDRCCCPHPDAYRCSEWRGGSRDEACECGCHDGGEDVEDGGAEEVARTQENSNG